MLKRSILGLLAATVLTGPAAAQAVDPDDGGDRGDIIIADMRMPTDEPSFGWPSVKDFLACQTAADRAACYLKADAAHQRPYANAYSLTALDHPAWLAAAGGEPRGAWVYDIDVVNRAVLETLRRDRRGLRASEAVAPVLAIEPTSPRRPRPPYEAPSDRVFRLMAWERLWIATGFGSGLAQTPSDALKVEVARRWGLDYLAATREEQQRADSADDIAIALFAAGHDALAERVARTEDPDERRWGTSHSYRVQGLILAGRLDEALGAARSIKDATLRGHATELVLKAAVEAGAGDTALKAADLMLAEDRIGDRVPIIDALYRFGRREQALALADPLIAALPHPGAKAGLLRITGRADEADRIAEAELQRRIAAASTPAQREGLVYELTSKGRWAEAMAVRGEGPVREIIGGAMATGQMNAQMSEAFARLSPRRQSQALLACVNEAARLHREAEMAECAHGMEPIAPAEDLAAAAQALAAYAAFDSPPSGLRRWTDLAARFYIRAVALKPEVRDDYFGLSDLGVAELEADGRW